ncbi:hypothetical protein MKJ01_16265 [Chryseobacterium sp. SSA4.19]|uniref:hypothetical protein n=1 Tax=Chryseobacterium sp. SSA4.19 TaxID=2919915 RepID=UPI001F4DA9BF|nr:hypothetical protein [Chryseobacterium sp. SSA4.19]MCJ8155321.1 hypothetical protein [Chryseobacterium sp. SSA4.19]
MKKIYVLLALFIAIHFFAQNSQLYYSGYFLNHKNKPQNFLKVFNKNSGVYEMTDEKGFAVIAGKPFDTLVWNNDKNKAVLKDYQLRELKDILTSRIKNETVKNIYNKTYDSLVSNHQNDPYSIESADNFLSKNYNPYFFKIKNIKQKNDSVYKIQQLYQETLVINGSFTASFEIKSRNAIPHVQNRFVQGRSENGLLVWKGPETHEMFSFGPDISTLGFDHEPYEYDQNGKLVGLDSGISPAKAYDNNIFKTTVGFSNQLRVNTILKKDHYEILRLAVDLGQQKDQMYFADQFNMINSLKTKLSSNFKGYIVDLSFNYDDNKATHANRIGFFNRVYQNALLTPVSFSNMQNVLLSDGSQRRYSRFADNPMFLLKQEDKYTYQSKRKQFSVNAIKTFGNFRLNFSQSYENDSFWNIEHYQPSTNGFINGLRNERVQNNFLYNSTVFGNYSFGDYDFKNDFRLNFILNNQESDVNNSLTDKKQVYQRTSQDYLFNYNLEIHKNDLEMGANLGNSFYISNTSAENKYWLPKANAYLLFKDVFNWRRFNFKVLGAYTALSSEQEITRSYASYATTLLNAENAFQYFPVNEVETFRGLSSINTKEWKTGFKIDAGFKISIEGEYFNRKIFNDVFPVYENNQLILKNLADHTYSGYEFNFSYHNFRISNNFFSTQKVSFFRYRDMVDHVENGYNNLAVSGFNDLYKTLTQGQTLGAVMGSYFLRNGNGHLVIDESGYPEKADGVKIIADPTPDFVMKFNHNFSFKRWTLDINWEWQKGGQLWNGTQAVLDYYGRSQISADQRNIKNYIFEGVQANGSINHTPVDFYDPNRNVNQNRWIRYGYLGVAEEYVQKADHVRISSIALSANLPINRTGTSLIITFYVNNIVVWQANSGADPNQNFYDQENGRGLDFFNLPSFKTYGCMVSFKF